MSTATAGDGTSLPGASRAIGWRPTTPDNWVPLLPVQTDAGLRLKRGKVLKPDGTQRARRGAGPAAQPERRATAGLMLYEEEIPREGVRVTRSYQLARWQDGSTHLWIGRRKRIGRGEGSSGLSFDRVGDPQAKGGRP